MSASGLLGFSLAQESRDLNFEGGRQPISHEVDSKPCSRSHAWYFGFRSWRTFDRCWESGGVPKESSLSAIA